MHSVLFMLFFFSFNHEMFRWYILGDFLIFYLVDFCFWCKMNSQNHIIFHYFFFISACANDYIDISEIYFKIIIEFVGNRTSIILYCLLFYYFIILLLLYFFCFWILFAFLLVCEISSIAENFKILLKSFTSSGFIFGLQILRALKIK